VSLFGEEASVAAAAAAAAQAAAITPEARTTKAEQRYEFGEYIDAKIRRDTT